MAIDLDTDIDRAKERYKLTWTLESPSWGRRAGSGPFSPSAPAGCASSPRKISAEPFLFGKARRADMVLCNTIDRLVVVIEPVVTQKSTKHTFIRKMGDRPTHRSPKTIEHRGGRRGGREGGGEGRSQWGGKEGRRGTLVK